MNVSLSLRSKKAVKISWSDALSVEDWSNDIPPAKTDLAGIKQMAKAKNKTINIVTKKVIPFTFLQ